MAVLLGAATAVAQTGSAGSTSSGTTDTTRRNQTGTSTTGSTTTDRSSGTTGSSAAPSGTYGSGAAGTGTTGSSGSTYGTGGTSTTGTSAVTGRSTMAGSDKLSWGDRRFVHKAADGGQSEIQVAQLAAERATNAEVRNFAQKLVDNHSKVNSELMSLASQKNLKLDTDDDKDRAYKRLSKKSGSEFDQEFVEHMIDEHEKDIKMFEKAASDAKDPELRSFASKHVGHLREHLQTAQNLRQALMPTGRTDDSSGRSTPGGTTGSGLDPSSSTDRNTDTLRTPRDSSTNTSPGSTGSTTTRSTDSDTSTTTRPDRSR